MTAASETTRSPVLSMLAATASAYSPDDASSGTATARLPVPESATGSQTGSGG
ncbi:MULTISPECIES: hypothetical protein [unclassified Haloarcula]|uniref:hypothetical protein n=1 Tax=unclassified Haloarcula TaxID=2624677 RepID=UPI0012AB9C44|nr:MULTISPECIES: hypothetical protein [unclassified Haloarcula]